MKKHILIPILSFFCLNLIGQFSIQADFNTSNKDDRLESYQINYKEPAKFSGTLIAGYGFPLGPMRISCGLGYNIAYSRNGFIYKHGFFGNAQLYNNVNKMLYHNMTLPVEAVYPISSNFGISMNVNNTVSVYKRFGSIRLNEVDNSRRFESTDFLIGVEWMINKIGIVPYVRIASIKPTNKKIFFEGQQTDPDYLSQVNKALDLSNPLMLGLRIKRNFN